MSAFAPPMEDARAEDDVPRPPAGPPPPADARAEDDVPRPPAFPPPSARQRDNVNHAPPPVEDRYEFTFVGAESTYGALTQVDTMSFSGTEWFVCNKTQNERFRFVWADSNLDAGPERRPQTYPAIFMRQLYQNCKYFWVHRQNLISNVWFCCILLWACWNWKYQYLWNGKTRNCGRGM